MRDVNVYSQKPEPTIDRRRHTALGWTLLVFWLFSAGAVLGYFTFKDQRSFESPSLALFSGAQRANAAQGWFRRNVGLTGVVTVVNVERTGCSCNRFSAKHRSLLRAEFSRAGVSFIDVQPPSSLPWIDATPAVLVFDTKGKLVYFGPYSSSAWCGVSGGLVEPVLRGLLHGKNPEPQSFYGNGCFCGHGRGNTV